LTLSKHINFGSFVKFNLLVSLSLGIVIGVIFFIVGALGGNVSAKINGETYRGFGAGVFSLDLFYHLFYSFLYGQP
jgi:hypothetical protein